MDENNVLKLKFVIEAFNHTLNLTFRNLIVQSKLEIMKLFFSRYKETGQLINQLDRNQ